MSVPFDILASEYRPMVLTYLRSMVQDGHLAEDLTQETFIAAQASLGKFEQGGNFGRWLRGIARNKALMHWRSARRSPLVVDSRVVDGIDEVFDQLDRGQEEGDWWQKRREALSNCLRGLSAQLKSAVEQVYHEGRSLEEAAEVLGSSRLAIGQRLSRARKSLRVCVSGKIETMSRYE